MSVRQKLFLLSEWSDICCYYSSHDTDDKENRDENVAAFEDYVIKGVAAELRNSILLGRSCNQIFCLISAAINLSVSTLLLKVFIMDQLHRWDHEDDD